MKEDMSLVDTETAARIKTRLKPTKVDNWAPTRKYIGGHLESFYQNTVKPNIMIIIFIVVVLIFVVYRYRQMAVQKKIEKLAGGEAKKNKPWKPDRKTMEAIQDEIRRIQDTEEAAAIEREIEREIEPKKKKRQKI